MELLPGGAALRSALAPVASLPELGLALASTREPVLALSWLWPSP
jgi:hypothetical protein